MVVDSMWEQSLKKLGLNTEQIYHGLQGTGVNGGTSITTRNAFYNRGVNIKKRAAPSQACICEDHQCSVPASSPTGCPTSNKPVFEFRMNLLQMANEVSFIRKWLLAETTRE